MEGPQFAFWRCLVGAAVYQSILVALGRPIGWRHLRDGFVGGVGFGVSILFLFVAFKTTTLTSANVITALQPLLMGVVTTRYHHEPLPAGGIAAAAVAIAGTVVVVLGSSGGGTWSLSGDLLAVAGIVTGALYPIGTKSARRSMDALQFQAAALAVAAPICLLGSLVVSGGPSVPTGEGWWFVLGIVGVGGTGHLIFSWAQHHVTVAASSVILLMEIVVSAIGAAILFDEPIHVLQVVGMAIVMGGIALWVTRRSAAPVEADLVSG